MFLKSIRKIYKKHYKLLLVPLVLFLVLTALITLLQVKSFGKINPGIKIAGIDLSDKTKYEAFLLLSKNISSPESISLIHKDKKYEIKLKNLGFSYDLDKSIDKVYLLTRTGNFFYDLSQKISLLTKSKNFGLEISLDEKSFLEEITKVANDIEIKSVKPGVTINNNAVEVYEGKKGQTIDLLTLRANIGKQLSFNEKGEIEIPLQEEGTILNKIEIEKVRQRATKLIGKSIYLSFNDSSFTINDKDIISFIDPKKEYYDEIILEKITEISSKINRDPQNSVFVFEGTTVKEFKPSLDGYEVNIDSLKNKIIGNIRTLEQGETLTVNLDIPVTITKPNIQNKDVNNLGIETLLGKGISTFNGSITNRIYNIGHASSKFKGILIAPGERFSFNKTLGDVSKETGYKQAYIIKEGKTILGDGGGVCQVSTTLFRAALNAGLPILERQAHAYRVSYYEQDSPPGLDATVFEPHPDLVFENNTPNYLLIQSIYNEKARTLVFEIYGTSDGRISKVTKPVITSSTPPPEDLYQDDPTLSLGTVKQIEHKAWGAKVRFDYEVTKNGEIIFKKTFYSNYQPWQAVYLRGTMPVSQ